jgi:hypothetical protein
MDIILKILLTTTIALILHELTHLLVILYYKIPIKAIIITKWTAAGFLVDNEKYMNDPKKLILLHFLPLSWCFAIFINLNEPALLMFPLVNIFGGLGDIYYFYRYVSLPLEERIAWANRSDEKIRKSIIWMKEFRKTETTTITP